MVSKETIQEIVRLIADRYRPEQIVLFGSYAYGKPEPWSDIDLLVLMDETADELETALEIRKSLPPYPFTLDILVRSNKTVQERKNKGDWFLREILSKGRLVYARSH